MISWPPTQIPVVTEHGDGYILYIETDGAWDNDRITVVLKNGGRILHYLSGQINIFNNATYSIKKQ